VDTTAEVVAANVAEEAPAAMVIDAGTVAAVLLSERLTTAPPAGAAPVSATVQVLKPPPITVAGAHWMEESRIADEADTVKFAVCDKPLYVAVIGAARVENPANVLTAKLAEADPAGTVTDPGIVMTSLIVDRPTAAPPEGAALDSATVQALGLPPVTVEGEHWIDSVIDGVVTDNELVCETPPKLAVITADWLDVTAEVEAVKVVEDDPAGIVTDPGTVTDVLLSAKLTTAPPAGAAAVRFTVQMELAPPTIDPGLQTTEDKFDWTLPDTEMVPPVCATINPVPDPRTDEPLVMVTGMVDADGVSVKVMAAITPFTIGFKFIPLTSHV